MYEKGLASEFVRDLVGRPLFGAFAGCTSPHIICTISLVLGRTTENHLSEGYDLCFGGPVDRNDEIPIKWSETKDPPLLLTENKYPAFILNISEFGSK